MRRHRPARTEVLDVMRGLADDGRQVFLPLEVSRKFGKFQVDGEAGYNIQQKRSNELWLGVVGAFEASSRVDLLAELHSIGSAHFAENESVFDLGTRIRLTKLNTLLFHDPARMRMDASKLSDEQLAISVRNRETTALLTWEPYMHNPKLPHRLPRVAAPTLFVRGQSDGLVSATYVESYARLLPDARVATIAAAGHAPHIEQPEEFARTALAFLESGDVR